MGWTEYHANNYLENGKVDRRAECRAYFMDGLNSGYYDVLKDCMVGATYYAAIRNPKTGFTFCAVFRTHVDNSKWFNFAYKDMEESMIPYYYDCPNSILDLLSDTEDNNTNLWRNECRARNAEKRKKTTLANLPIGTVIRCTFNGKTFDLEKSAPAYQFKRPFWMCWENCTYVPKTRIPKDFTIIE